MQLLLEELSHIVAEEYRQYEALFAATQAEQTSLVAGDTDGLDRSLGEIQGQLGRAESLARRRQMILAKIAEDTNVPSQLLTLTRLAEMSTGMTALRLERLAKDFSELMAKLHRMNGTNLLLIRNSMDMNDRTVRLILGETGQVHFYGEAGMAERSADPKVLSRRI